MCDQPQPTGIYQAMAEILAEIPSIGKDNKNKEQGFKYRGIDDVYNALHPLLAKHKVFMPPQCSPGPAKTARPQRAVRCSA